MSKSTPRVSVVIDNYNYGHFLPAAIDSVLAQDFPQDEIEIIVVDDGSRDDSLKVLERYGDRLTVLTQKNSGYAAAFNHGIPRTQGEFICLLDADDVWRAEKIRRVVAHFEENPEVGIVQHFLEDTDAELIPLPMDYPRWPERTTIEDYLAGQTAFTATSALSFRRETLLRTLPIPSELRFLYADDYLTVHSLLLAPGGNIPEPLGSHRVHGENFCAGNLGDPKKLADDFAMRKVFRDRLDGLLSQHHRDLSPQYRRLEDLELLRREILFHVHEGRRLSAAALWAKGLGAYAFDLFGLFRVGSCVLALISPRLYLAAYSSYSSGTGLKTLRRRLLPD